MDDALKNQVAPMPSIEDLKAAVEANHELLTRHLAKMRAERDALNKCIANTVADLKSADRPVKAFEPKQRKPVT